MLFNLVAGQKAYKSSVERFGGELLALYAVSGRYDAVSVVRFPDAGSCMAFVLASEAQGQYAEQLTALDAPDLERAEAVHAAAILAATEEEQALARQQREALDDGS